MKKIDSAFDAMEILKNEFPKCFRRGNEKLPLTVGIHVSVLKYYKGDERFDDETLKKAIGLYCKGTKYIASIIADAPRIDIEGKPVSTVKKSEAKYAAEILTKRQERKNLKKQKEAVPETPLNE